MLDNKFFKEKIITNFIKHPIIAFTIIFLITAIIIPTIIQIFYLIGRTKPVIYTVFDPNYILSFWGSIMVFIGTSILGVASYIQNDKLKNANERLLKLEKNRDKPFIKATIVTSRIELEETIGNLFNLRVSFSNIGKGLSVDTCFFAPKIVHKDSGEIITSKNEYDNVFIPLNEAIELNFKFCDVNLYDSGDWLFCINIHTEDINSIEIKQVINIPIDIHETKIGINNVLYASYEYCDYAGDNN